MTSKIPPKKREVADDQMRQLQKEINFDTKDYPIGVIVDKFKNGDFYIPEYQRNLTGIML